ncbi:hypothetical protein PsorP6_001370 [Peronosclerospora sorghi]|uniref:Uncharacterized protein n=1 Tax=Peronosclerospora sorghi TaxID=230839 RepID=A0ACC0WXT6_9STRA|nr:hypothetical protein PsorP6_001370 [Peronosclerospora sorghi]
MYASRRSICFLCLGKKNCYFGKCFFEAPDQRMSIETPVILPSVDFLLAASVTCSRAASGSTRHWYVSLLTIDDPPLMAKSMQPASNRYIAPTLRSE